jgi:hypothetical protein
MAEQDELKVEHQTKPPPTIDTQTGGDDTDLQAAVSPEPKPPPTIEPETRGG